MQFVLRILRERFLRCPRLRSRQCVCDVLRHFNFVYRPIEEEQLRFNSAFIRDREIFKVSTVCQHLSLNVLKMQTALKSPERI